MWLMYERTNQIVTGNLANNIIPPTPAEITDAIGTQIFGAMTLALALYLFQNDSGLRGNNGLSGLQNIPGLDHLNQAQVSIGFFWASAIALALGYLLFVWVLDGKFGNVIKAIRDDETRLRFLGYHVESYKLFIFTVTAMIAGIAVRCCPRCDLRVAPVQLFHRRQRTRHQPWGLCDQMDRLVACPAWPVLRRGHALLPRRYWQPL